MKKYLCLLPALLLIMCMASCSRPEKETEYTHVIPANATEVAALNVKSLIQKGGYGSSGHSAPLADIVEQLAEGNGEKLMAEAVLLLLDTPLTGLDLEVPAYLFKAPNLHTQALAVKMADLTKFEAMIKLLAWKKLCTTPAETKDYRYVEIEQESILLAYNNGTLLAVQADSPEQLKKLLPGISALMSQQAGKSIHANTHFASMMKQKGDIRLLTTPDALPMDVRGVLSWPHGTQLSGYVLFEKGRIYATLQEAGFSGQTGESNQPFHPNNSRELQQVLLGMMRGAPFNLSLTSEELLTLSNLRILIEKEGEQPEVNTLYLLIRNIEELNLRGDKNRTNFTVVLNEKNKNSLKQLIGIFLK